MKKYIKKTYVVEKLIVSLTLISLLSCNEDKDSPSPSIITELEGVWQIESGILDLQEVESWSETTMKISSISDSSVSIVCENQPLGRENIWPSQSTLELISGNVNQGLFWRNDGIDVRISFRTSGSLLIDIHPPREWSYNEECIEPDTNGFLCSSEGKWDFLIKK